MQITNKNGSDHTYTVASLFAGIGGFCLAFRNAGFKVLWANENDKNAVRTYEHNFPDVNLLTDSILDLSVVNDNLDEVDILTAGFPCQAFSAAGAQAGFDDPRGKLFFEIPRLIKEFGVRKPKILVLENVKNLLDHNKGKTFARIVEEIQLAGYWFQKKNVKVLNTKIHTDIPQNRERVYMVAFSWDHFDTSDFIFPEPVKEKRNLRDFFELENKALADLYFQKDSKYEKLFFEAMQNGDPESTYLLRRYYVRENKNKEVYTLTANMGEGGHNVSVIQDPWGIRKLTPEECLRLQGFPVDNTYSFPDTVARGQRYKQAGNSITVPLVEKLAVECSKQLIKRSS